MNHEDLQDQKPFRGPEAFRSQDASLFFGRGREARALVSKILTGRFTMLHARSGAGKTSLINTRILPDLERTRRLPVCIRMQENPVEATIVHTLQEVLPPPAAEILGIERAIDLVEECDEETTLEELKRLYDKIPLRDPTYRKLVSPVKVERSQLQDRLLPVHGPMMPYFCRVLRGSMGLSTLGEHLALYTGSAELRSGLTPDTRLGSLLDLLSNPGHVNRYDHMVARLWVEPDLASFFFALFNVHFAAEVPLRLVLIFDQFEVLFTRVAGEGARTAGAASDALNERETFLRELENLYQQGRHGTEAAPRLGGSEPSRDELPIRYVIAIRQDFIALLEDVRRWVPNLHERSYHLDFLTPSSAREAVQEPAAKFNMEFTDSCYQLLFEQSRFEGFLIDPTYLQIICDHLWTEYWDRPGVDDSSGDTIQIDENLLHLVIQDEGILTAFFRRFMQEELRSDEERLEALEILSELITGRGTRNSVLREQLTKVPYRDLDFRAKILDVLEGGHVVRAEQRLGSLFIEITLERMIEPIKRMIAERMEARDYQEFEQALRRLAQITGSNFRDRIQNPLEASHIRALERHQRRLNWGYLGHELMLRSAILEYPAGLDDWVGQLDRSTEVWDARKLLDDKTDRYFALDELARINKERGDPELAECLEKQLERIVVSSIVLETDDEAGRRNLIYWVKKLEEGEADGT